MEVNAFIVKCVLNNISLPSSTRVGIGQNYTVQDLAVASSNTLKLIGKAVEKAIKDHGGSIFEEGSALELPKDSGVHADDWLQFIIALLYKKNLEEKTREENQELQRIEKELENLKTPAERKKELLARRAQLQYTETGGA